MKKPNLILATFIAFVLFFTACKKEEFVDTVEWWHFIYRIPRLW
jgi:hypothetical protein